MVPPGNLGTRPFRESISALRFVQFCHESGELTADREIEAIISYLQDLASKLLLTTGIPRQVVKSLQQQSRCHVSSKNLSVLTLNLGHWTRPHGLPKEHQNQKYKPLKEQEPVFHKMIYQNDAHVVMVNEADTLTDEMITDIVHHGFIGMRVKNLGAPAVACFAQSPPNNVSIDLCYTDARKMNDKETWIATGAVFRVNFGNRSRASEPEIFVESKEQYEQISSCEQAKQAGVNEFFDILHQEQQSHF